MTDDPPQARDPRVDPKDGDTLRRGNVTRRILVSYPDDSFQFYRETAGYCGSDQNMNTLVQWRQWARRAEVIHAAD